MIVVFTASSGDKAGEVDYVVFTSIYFASTIVDGPIVPYSPELSFSKAEQLAFVGHGSIGAIRSINAAMLSKHLTDDVLGVNKSLNKMVFTSCFAGRKDQHDKSLIDTVAEGLQGFIDNDLTIYGYTGPSIKNSSIALTDPAISEFVAGMFGKSNDAVVNAPSSTHNNSTEARTVQAQTLKDVKFEKIERTIPELFPDQKMTQLVRFNKKKKPSHEVQSTQKSTVELSRESDPGEGDKSKVQSLSQLSMRAIAKYNSTSSAEFYKTFINRLHEKKLLFAKGEAVASAHIKGSKSFKRKAGEITKSPGGT